MSISYVFCNNSHRRDLIPAVVAGWLLLLMLFTTNQSHAQRRVVAGTLVDARSLHPISYAHLRVKGTNQGTVANSEGKFSLLVKEQLQTDTLSISSIGYESLTLAINQLVENDTLFLKEADITLNSVIVTPFSAKELVRKSVQAIPANYPQTAYQLYGFFLTATRECQTYVRLLEGPVHVTDAGYASENILDTVYPSTKKSEDYRKYQLEERVLFEDALTFEHVRLKNGFLNPANLDEWAYEIAGYTKYNERDLYIISANYLADKNKINHSATIYLGEDDLAIHKVEYQYHWLDRHFVQTAIDSLIEAEYNWEGEFHYASHDDDFYLKYFVFHHTKSIHDRMLKHKVCDIEVYTEFSTHEVYRDEEGLRGDRMEPIEIVKTNLHQEILRELDSLSYDQRGNLLD